MTDRPKPVKISVARPVHARLKTAQEQEWRRLGREVTLSEVVDRMADAWDALEKIAAEAVRSS